MKKHNFYALLFAAGVLAQCGGGDAPQGDEASDDLFATLGETVQHDLNKHGYPLVVHVPAPIPGSMIPEAEVSVTASGSVEIRVGKDFQIQITDGDGNLAAKKEHINLDDVYKADYLTDEPDGIIYKQSVKIEGAELDPEHHFIRVIRVQGRTIEVSDINDDKFSFKAVERMYDFAKAITVKPAA